MKWFVSHFSKNLVLLAIAWLPIQQCLAVTCCCQAGQQRVKQATSESWADRCAQGKASCCKGANRSKGSCCADGSSHLQATSCQCPVGCDKTATPTAVDPATTSWSWDYEATQSVPESILATAGATTTNGVSTADAISPATASGTQRCVQLCRFLL